MLTKAQIHHLQSLSQKKERLAAKSFIAEGDKVVNELIKSNNLGLKNIFALPSWVRKNEHLLNSYPIVEINERELERISQLTTPQQVLGEFEIPESKLDVAAICQSTFLILDGINDPGNLGTIIRIADWFGIKDIVCSIGSVDVYSPKVVQSTMGSIARVNVFYCDLKELLPQITLPVFGAFLNGSTIYNTVLPAKAAIVMGSESHGISSQIEELISNKISIPTFNTNGAESLNVAVSTGIICSEFFRTVK